MNWKALSTDIRWNVQPSIDGCYRSSASTECFDNINPATEHALRRISVGSAADVDEAVSVAHRRFNDGCWSEGVCFWAAGPLFQRYMSLEVAQSSICPRWQGSWLRPMELPTGQAMQSCVSLQSLFLNTVRRRE